MRRGLTYAWVFLCAGLSGAVLADTQLNYQHREFKNPHAAPKEYLIRIKPPYVRAGSQGGWVLFDGDKNTLLIVDEARKTYTEMNPAMLAQLAVAVSQSQLMLQEMLENLPPEERAAAEEAIGSVAGPQPGAELRYQETGKTRTVAGHACRVGELRRDTEKVMIICVAEPNRLGMPREDQALLDRLFKLTEELRASAGNMAGQLPSFADVRGVPIESLDNEHGQQQTLTDVSHDRLDHGLFRLPPDYRKEALSIPRLNE